MADDFKDLGFESNAGFDDLGFEHAQAEQPQAQKKSEIESALRGAAQGLTFNFADEIEAAVRAGGEALTGKIDPTVDDVVGAYKRQKEGISQEYQQAREDNPITYNASNIGTAIVSPLNKIGLVGSGAAMGLGAAQDLGQDAVKQTLIGGGLGLLGGVAGNVAAKAAPMVEKGIIGNTRNVVKAASTGLGGMIGGVPGAIVGAASEKAVNRVVSPIVKSGATKISELLQNNPQALGKFANSLQQAFQRGPDALKANIFVLKQQSPEFRQLVGDDNE